jgi:hypothetical protein
VLDWILSVSHANDMSVQFGFYNFTESQAQGGMGIPDLRTCAMAAVRYYNRDGKLVEDQTDSFLTCAQSTYPPGPVSYSEVWSVADLERAVAENQSLVYGQARSLATVYQDALRWTHQYDGINLSLSDGPRIVAWPSCHRTINYGGEEFVTGRMVMPALLSLQSDVGLKEARLYNGAELYRRFVLKGAKEFNQLLVLEGAVQKSLVLVAEDVNGGRAVSFARRCWKDGAEAVVFCSDHVNDCKSPGDGPLLLAHGPYNLTVNYTPQVPEGGETWDGGPAASKPLVYFVNSSPILKSDKGSEDGGRFAQTPLLEFTDELAAAVSSVRQRIIDERVIHINPWHGFGPTRDSQLMDYTVRFRSWITPSVGPRSAGWTGPGMRVGIKPTLFRSEITFKDDQKLESLLLFQVSKSFGVSACTFARSVSNKVATVEATKLPTWTDYRVGTGDWFGVFSPDFSNSYLFINRGEPMVVQVAGPQGGGGTWMMIRGDIKGRQVKRGDKLTYELFTMNYPLESSAKKVEDFEAMLRYLAQPDGLNLVRGKRVTSAGILDLQGKDSVVEFSIPKPAGWPKMTIPARVQGLNRRWSAGLWLQGRGYTPMGVDAFGNGYVPVNVTWADETHIMAGHPIIADKHGKDLFIQVTHLNDNPQLWHVSVNNPTDRKVKTKLRQVMAVPGLAFKTRTVTLKPGEYQVLQ